MHNCRFNADANMGHRFAILMAHVGTFRAPAPVTLGISRSCLQTFQAGGRYVSYKQSPLDNRHRHLLPGGPRDFVPVV